VWWKEGVEREELSAGMKSGAVGVVVGGVQSGVRSREREGNMGRQAIVGGDV